MKTRPVAQGFSQINEIDYLNIYLFIVKLVLIRILLTIVVIYKLESYQIAIETAFLARELEEI